MKRICVVVLLLFCVQYSFAQIVSCTCTASVGSGNVNFSTLTWTGGPGCPTASTTSFAGNLCVSLANGSNLIMNNDLSIAGGFRITNTGNSKISIPSGTDLVISGHMGDDDNNNVTFAIDGNLTVTGTIYGKNTNAFDASGTGQGKVVAGGLDFGQAPTCTPSCSGITWTVGSCKPTGSTFCNSLPVTLIFFDAQADTEKVSLTWATATEKNASYFSIERSINGSQFTEIGQKPAAGNSSVKIYYSFDDNNPLVGRTYYRLKAVDLDGYTEYFNIEVVDFTGKREVNIFPNPYVEGSLSIALNYVTDQTATGSIEDLSGRQIVTFKLINGSFATSDLELNPGTYVVKVSSSDRNYVTRFVAK